MASSSRQTKETTSASRDSFVTTRWTAVLASRGESIEAKQALSDLCAAYYAPVVAFLRRERRNEDEARELAHEFFAEMLEGRAFAGADPRRGRFRSYLLGGLKHFLADRRDREVRMKRGGGAVHEPLHTDPSTGLQIAQENAPLDATFDQEWALSVLERTIAKLRLEWQGREAEFEAFKPFLTGVEAKQNQSTLAHQLNLSDGALRVALHRFRRRFRDLLKGEIALTVEEPAEIDDEIRHLIRSLSQ